MEARLVNGLMDLPARDRTLARLRLEISGDSLQSRAPAEDAVIRYPDDAEAWYMLGEIRYHEPGMAGAGHSQAREAFEKAIELAPGFVPYYYHPLAYAIGAGDRERTEVLMGFLEEAVPDDPDLAQMRLAMSLLLGPLDEAIERVRDDPGPAVGATFQLPIATHMIPRVWTLVGGLPTEGEIRITDLKSAWAMTAGRQAEALELMNSIPLGNGTRVTLARHHQDVLGGVPGMNLDREFDLAYCGAKDVPVQASCYEKAALRAVDAGRYDEARRVITEQDSIAQTHEFPRAARIHRRMARTVEGYLGWKTGDMPSALRNLEAARELDLFAVTARWYLADVYVDAGRPMESIPLLLSIDDSPTWSPFSRLRVAEVFESMGDAAQATRHYEAALAAWSEADEDFAPAQRARAGLSRVGG
jgi:tetratricopeptide (TPR) repeat protein